MLNLRAVYEQPIIHIKRLGSFQFCVLLVLFNLFLSLLRHFPEVVPLLELELSKTREVTRYNWTVCLRYDERDDETLNVFKFSLGYIFGQAMLYDLIDCPDHREVNVDQLEDDHVEHERPIFVLKVLMVLLLSQVPGQILVDHIHCTCDDRNHDSLTVFLHKRIRFFYFFYVLR